MMAQDARTSTIEAETAALAEMSPTDLVKVKITAQFYNAEAMRVASSKLTNPETFAYAWMRVEMLRGERSQVKVEVTSLPNVIVVPLSQADKPGWRAMRLAGMLQVSRGDVGDNTAYRPTQADFDMFWLTYPARIVGGIATKGVKHKAQTLFQKVVTSPAVLAELMKAVKSYVIAANGYPKDAERFLRDDVWTNYLQQ